MFDRIPENPGRVKITPESGGAAYYAKMERADNPVQEGTPINKATLLTDETAALFNFGPNAVPNDVFAKMSEGVFSKIVGKYTNTSTFGDLAVGQSVFININGKPTEFLVAHQGVPQTCIYADSTYDGTFLIAKNIYEKKAWSWQLGTTDYSLSEINAYLNGDFYNSIDDEAKALIKQINVPYRSGTSGQTIKLLPAKVFLPSVREVQETTNGTYKPSDGGKFSLFDDSANRIALFEGTTTPWWTRSGHINSQSSGVWCINTSGSSEASGPGGNYGIRPVIVMQPNGLVYLDKNENAYIKQKYDNFLVNVIDETIGIPASQIVGGVQAALVSYKGTGTRGTSNPCALVFDFAPKVILYIGFVPEGARNLNTSNTAGVPYVIPDVLTTGYSQSTGFIQSGNGSLSWAKKSEDGKTISWYNTDSQNGAYNQLNSSTNTYYFLAIG